MPDAPVPSSPQRVVASEAELLSAVRELVPGLTRRALLLVGGADFTNPELVTTLRGFFANLASWCDRTGTAVVDGGTDSGVMRLIGRERAAIGGTFPLLGVAPSGVMGQTSADHPAIEAARGHTAVFLVLGSTFGDEMAALFAVADELAGGHAPTILVNGGNLSMQEASMRLQAGELVVAVAGSGRAADALASTAEADNVDRLRSIDVSADGQAIEMALEAAMTAGR